MQVTFDFAVGPQKYRIIRKRSRGKTKSSPGQSSLDLFIANGDIYRPISGDRIGDTEKKIVETLHMDYDTFINSAFLRQGHADQFTVARPQERKAVLTSILGLSEYDRLETAAATRLTSVKPIGINLKPVSVISMSNWPARRSSSRSWRRLWSNLPKSKRLASPSIPI